MKIPYYHSVDPFRHCFSNHFTIPFVSHLLRDVRGKHLSDFICKLVAIIFNLNEIVPFVSIFLTESLVGVVTRRALFGGIRFCFFSELRITGQDRGCPPTSPIKDIGLMRGSGS